ncbi:MAG: DUF4440 domain-containing protein [Gammaproteobacteria bacterium]|nr:DUF4440 domain-containing protein [Gammaproteobacteria bacterium]
MKRFQFSPIVLVIVLLAFLFSNPLIAASSDANAVQQAYFAWCKTMGTAKGDAEKIVKFYAPNALLLPTLSPEILKNENGGLNAYFAALTARDQFKCTPQKLITQLYGSLAINSGTYTFSYVDQNHHLQKVPSRFTFVYEKTGTQWQIVNHHSSVLPSK